MAEMQQCRSLAVVVLSAATSGRVYPVVGFAAPARPHGARTIEVNPGETDGSGAFHESGVGKAGEMLAPLVPEILSG